MPSTNRRFLIDCQPMRETPPSEMTEIGTRAAKSLSRVISGSDVRFSGYETIEAVNGIDGVEKALGEKARSDLHGPRTSSLGWPRCRASDSEKSDHGADRLFACGLLFLGGLC
jgi:hypothetical protein